MEFISFFIVYFVLDMSAVFLVFCVVFAFCCGYIKYGILGGLVGYWVCVYWDIQ